MGIAHYVLITVLSFALAGGLIWILDRPLKKPEPSTNDQNSRHPAILLYQSGLLIDANETGRDLLQAPGGNKSEWCFVSEKIADRFPGFPMALTSVEAPVVHTFPAAATGDFSFVTLEQWDQMARVKLRERRETLPAEKAGLAPVSNVLDDAPYPIWQSDSSGNVTWANPAYLRLADSVGLASEDSTVPEVFDKTPRPGEAKPARSAVTNASENQSYWFDISTTERDSLRTHYAADANAIVNAEIAQRNFVQTLTKTFAQLSIGLAIFDRNRQLALFNPALIDLTSLPADFLSSRPNLQTFFDRMRENRMMPEPRNYASWREHLAEVVVAASDDRYTETWSLPSGVTYRVVGRPHPDGAIAFLFEDISAEVSLTRRFRSDLELGLSTLDAVSEGVAVFSSSGKLGFCNSAFKELWEVEPELSIAEYSLRDALHHWRVSCQKTEVWERLRHHVLDLNPRETWRDEVMLISGKQITLRVVSLNGGYTSILFEPKKAAASNRESMEMMAG